MAESTNQLQSALLLIAARVMIQLVRLSQLWDSRRFWLRALYQRVFGDLSQALTGKANLVCWHELPIHTLKTLD